MVTGKSCCGVTYGFQSKQKALFHLAKIRLACLFLFVHSENLVAMHLLQWMMKGLVICHRESIISLKRKYLKVEMEETLSSSHASMDAILDIIAKEGCSSLLDEVFMDLDVGTFFLKQNKTKTQKALFSRKNNSGMI